MSDLVHGMQCAEHGVIQRWIDGDWTPVQPAAKCWIVDGNGSRCDQPLKHIVVLVSPTSAYRIY